MTLEGLFVLMVLRRSHAESWAREGGAVNPERLSTQWHLPMKNQDRR